MLKTKIILGLALIVIAVGALAVYIFPKVKLPGQSQNPDTKNVDAVETAKDPKFTSFTLQGTITEVKGTKITFKTSVVSNGEVTNQTKVAEIDSGTTVVLGSGNFEAAAKSSDLKVGQKVTFTTAIYPYDKDNIKPYKIAILSIP
jgi:hypothetical protein